MLRIIPSSSQTRSNKFYKVYLGIQKRICQCTFSLWLNLTRHVVFTTKTETRNVSLSLTIRKKMFEVLEGNITLTNTFLCL